MTATKDSIQYQRTFLSNDFELKNWEDIKSYYDDLVERPIDDEKTFMQWLRDWSELSAIVSEDAGWRYIKMTINTADEEAAERYNHFVKAINPKLQKVENDLNQKLVQSPFFKKYKEEDPYRISFKNIETSIRLFREENLELQAQINSKSSEYGNITGAMQIQYDDKELTMQQAAQYLKKQDESIRKEVYERMQERRLEDTDKLDTLFDELLALRHQVAVNAGFDNFRDYMFESMGRFDYTPDDCFAFHESIEKEIVPVLRKIEEKKLEKMGKERFRPWDLSVDPEGREPLEPFQKVEELIAKSITIFDKINPDFGNVIRMMDERKHLDLDSRNNKAPGGYNYPLYESNLPFIFMNAVGSHSDLITMMHEGGHAIHSVLTKDLELTDFKSLTSEIAELASMSMELISMDYWNEFYNDNDLFRAKQDQFERVLEVLPWVATVDSFQHWIYTHPNQTREERTKAWLECFNRFSTGLIDWSGYELSLKHSWHKQLHIFEVPFYYIEYGMAQLGAVAVWKNYKEHPEKALQQYKDALSLGYTKSIPEVYEAAGIVFDFSTDYVSELASFLQNEME